MPVLPDFEVTVLLQIELKRKMLGRSVTFEPNSIEKCFQKQNFFELTTPKGSGPGSCWAERKRTNLQANQWLNLQKKAYRKLLSEWTDLAYSMTKYSVFSVSITWNNFTMLGWSTVFIIRTSRNSFCKLPGFNWVLSMILIATCKKNVMETFHTKKPWFLTTASTEIPNFF